MISTHRIASYPASARPTRRNLPAAALLLFLLHVAPAPAQDTRGFEQQPTAPASLSPGDYYALVIGIDDYPSLPRLTTAVHDAQTVGTLLESSFGFKGRVTYLLNQNATRAHIMDALEGPKGYVQTLTASDNLLIYYAGHGYYNERTDKAYWLPYDAESAFSANHISADDLTTSIRGIASHHVLIIADSCYSGDLTRGVDDNINSSGGATGFIQRMMAAPSRNILSSGGNEPVADTGPGEHSIFAAALLSALSGQPGPFFTAADLADPVKRSVRAHSGQIPEYTRIGNSMPRNFPIDIGDFVFERKTAVLTNPKQPAVPAAAESAPPSSDASNRDQASTDVRDHGQALIDARKYDEALSFFNDACDRNNAQGCAGLGVLYFNGLGVTKDTARAATLARKACDAGYSGGCRNLGTYYLWGAGVDKDPAQAAALFRTACNAGDAHGCGWLGLLFINGTGVAQDRAQGLALSRKACDGGDMQGCADVGISYANGYCVEKDYAEAISFSRKACNGGFLPGCADVGVFYANGNGGEKDYTQAASFSQRACDGGFLPGCTNLGFVYQNGTGVEKDLLKAATLYEKACDGGEAIGCRNLANLYEHGWGVALDKNRASELLRKACGENDQIACNAINQRR